MKSFKEIILKVKSMKEKPKIVVPCPYDVNILESLNMIQEENIGDVVLVGDKEKIDLIKEKNNLNIKSMALIEKESDIDSLKESYSMIEKNKAHIIVKGKVQTKDFMNTILSDKRFIKNELLTHISIFHIPSQDKLLFVSDPSIIVEPTLEQKKVILDNALELLEYMEVENPKIAIISSVEIPNKAIKSSIDGINLMKLQEKYRRWNAEIHGPLAIDNAVSKEAAMLKNIDSKVAGDADLLLMPNLDSGNIFCKGLVYIGGLESASIVMGAYRPIVLTSRAAGVKERFNSICIACLLANKMKEKYFFRSDLYENN